MELCFTEKSDEESMDLLSKSLRDPNLALRHRAADILLEKFKKRAFEIFIEALEDPDWYVRNEAVWALGQIGDRRCEKFLIKALGDHERKVYRNAAHILTDFGWVPKSFEEKLRYYFAMSNFMELIKFRKQGFELLIEALKNLSKSWDLACKAAEALGLIGDPRAVPPLIEALKFDNLRVCIRSAEALGRIGDERAFYPLMDMLKKKDTELQLKVIEALGKLGNSEAFQIISSKLNDSDPQMRLTSVESLGYLSYEGAVEPLIEVIRKDKNFEIRRRAIRVLGKIKNSTSVPFLIDLFETASEELHEAIIETLGEISDVRSFDIFIRSLGSDSPEVRFLSARALGKLGNEDAADFLLKIIRDEDWRVCGEAIRALGRLKASSSLEPLKELLFHKRSYIRKLTVMALGNFGNASSFALQSALKDKHNYVRFLAAQALDKMEWSSGSEEKCYYYFAKRDYTHLISEGKTGIAVLLNGLRDNYCFVKDAVERFILSLDKDARPLLLSALSMKDPQIREGALKLFGELGTGEEIIINFLKDENSSVRRTSARVLRRFYPTPSIIEALTYSLEDSDQGVRQTARKSLHKLKKAEGQTWSLPDKKRDLSIEPVHKFSEIEREYSYAEMSASIDEAPEVEKFEGRDVMELCNKMEDCYYPEHYINIVLFEPKIPPNTGNIARLCAGTGSKLYLVGDLGFSFRDRLLKRAGLDYWHLLRMFYYPTMKELYEAYPESRFFYFSSNVKRPYTAIHYQSGDFLVFGPETPGLPVSMLAENPNNTVSIPMWGEARSFNLSTSVGIALYEALRQLNNGWSESITKI